MNALTIQDTITIRTSSTFVTMNLNGTQCYDLLVIQLCIRQSLLYEIPHCHIYSV